ncbi:endodeoxyribonuclease RusA [Stutzerimonas stutzeri]|uniref:endodeoxyribonuclease RusA n=1 Tax=Stutzerimonas stutzeri TaxID=316 RepID=UPI002658A33A|nr:endodeoxyribonuclease RusA [Stutzerimonas stutzeri]MCF6780900.1 endodeoxyribonuclease RusA [Stutzerimonas stutzeri]MCF6803470.1 endodeoxyribonuclease RusA [Stutzerimonas stutzeri]
MTEVLLPWPPKELSPNSRKHWRAKAPIAKKYRADCHLLCKAAGMVMPEGRALLAIEFLPPDRRKRDDDNMLSAFKAGRDGLADALGVDDSVFVSQVRLSKTVHPGGAVRVTLSPYKEGIE